MRVPVRREVVLGLALELLLLLLVALVVVLALPTGWQLRPFSPDGTDGFFEPRQWSPEGTALVLDEAGHFDVVASDGSVLLRNEPGWSPVWVADDRLLLMEPIDERTNRLIRLDLTTGDRQPIGDPLGAGRLFADGHGHVAHHEIGTITTRILDATTGLVVDRLGGYLPVRWTDRGALVLRQRVPGLENLYPDGGWLLVWEPGRPPRLPAPDLFELTDSAVLSPDGNALACLCMSLEAARAGRPWPDVYRIPLDGSEPSRLVRWRDAPITQNRPIAWRSDSSLDILDSHGVARLGEDGQQRMLLDLPQAHPLLQTPGRLFRLDTAVAVVSGPIPGTTNARVVVIDDAGRVRFDREVESVNLPYLVVDPSGERAILRTDPQHPGEAPLALFLLQDKEVLRERMEPGA
jgi:hypothetical protein